MGDIGNRLEVAIEDYAPNILGALAILAIGWLVAMGVAWLVRRVLHRTNLDERLARWMGARDVTGSEVAASSAAFWMVMVLVIVAALEALEFDAVTAPLSDAVSTILTFIPNLIAAALILLVGFIVARVLRQVAANAARAFGINRVAERAGVPGGAGRDLADVLGLVVFALVLIPTLVAALNALELESVATPTSHMLDELLVALPNIFGAAVLLGIAYIVGRIVAGLVANILAGVGFNEIPARLGMSPANAQVQGRQPSEVVGGLLLAAILVVAAMEASRLVGFVTLTLLIEDFLVYVGQVLVGLVIIAIGLWLSRLIADAVRSSGWANANLLANIARVAVIVLALAIGLGEMGIADEIVILAFALPLGALALGLMIGLGVAIGIGGRAVAEEELRRLRDAARS